MLLKRLQGNHLFSFHDGLLSDFWGIKTLHRSVEDKDFVRFAVCVIYHTWIDYQARGIVGGDWNCVTASIPLSSLYDLNLTALIKHIFDEGFLSSIMYSQMDIQTNYQKDFTVTLRRTMICHFSTPLCNLLFHVLRVGKKWVSDATTGVSLYVFLKYFYLLKWYDDI